LSLDDSAIAFALNGAEMKFSSSGQPISLKKWLVC